MSNNITDLRTTLFDTLRALSNPDNPMEIDRAKAINELAQTIINSAKVEVDGLKIIGGLGSGLIPTSIPAVGKVPKGVTHPAPGVTRHTID